MKEQLLFHLLALKLTNGIGDVLARNLISYSKGVEEIFKLKKSSLLKIPGIGAISAESISNKSSFAMAEKEMAFILKNNITVTTFLDQAYPFRMKQQTNLPFLLFVKGQANLNPQKTLAIVGTRRCTDYGREITKNIVTQLSNIPHLCIVSGLAYGIDKTAHQAAIDNNMATLGILGHGLHTIYPAQNNALAKQMVQHPQSGLVTQFASTETLLPANFPKRNEIIAALADAVLVIETDIKGGSKITAELAFEMNRDVMAIPGRVGDKYSRGCLQLIKMQKASLVEDANDIVQLMNWEQNAPLKAPQRSLFIELSAHEEQLVEVMKSQPEWHIDALSGITELLPGALSATLLSLEMKSIVQSLPGKVYKLLI